MTLAYDIINSVSPDKIKIERAKRHLLDFTLYTWPDYSVNWHHRILCKYLEQWAFGNLKRLMVFMPPGTGKSELVSRRLPAWIFGKNPDARIMSCSYGASLASDMNADIQRIMDSDEYKRVFPGAKLNERNIRTMSNTPKRNSETFEIVGHPGSYKCAGVGGAITGKRYFYGIIDDPIKGHEAAESLTVREKTWHWYNKDFYTRRANKDARILITLTRWQEDDLAGRLLDLSAKYPGVAEQWKVIKFPMIAEDPLEPEDPRKVGESLWPKWFGDASELEATKITEGSYSWNALYQQQPTNPTGNILNRNWWKFYKVTPPLDTIIQSWDCTFKDSDGTDYVVGQVWGKVKARRYLLDQVRARMDFPATVQAIKSLSAKWPAAIGKYIEDKANGPAVISTLEAEVPGLIAVNPKGGKVVRVHAVSPYIEAGNVYLPDPSIAPWIHDFIEECSAFPGGKFDDQVDAMSQALAAFLKEIISEWQPGDSDLEYSSPAYL